MKLVIYRTRGLRGTGYRWTLVADNGRKLANGGQAYSRRIDMEDTIERVTGGYFQENIHTKVRELRIPMGYDYEAVEIEDRT